MTQDPHDLTREPLADRIIREPTNLTMLLQMPQGPIRLIEHAIQCLPKLQDQLTRELAIGRLDPERQPVIQFQTMGLREVQLPAEQRGHERGDLGGIAHEEGVAERAAGV
ncbi:hypothetical protein KC327_g17961, partial [Hortaea werneckii]